MTTVDYKTEFGSVADFEKGGVTIINDNPKNYVFSNIYDVANTSAPYERVVVAINREYVIEAARAEGASPLYTNAHDEFVLCMDGEVEVELMKPEVALLPSDAEGAHLVEGEAEGQKMGRLVLGRGHQGLLPAGCLYRFSSVKVSVISVQSILGPVSVQKWADICQTEA
ncbi:MAG: hydroxyquinol 1,2-dioxygenase [Kordiimonas sp.]|nr:hydroxyquinol 1,2-dioxygenase [Kordiimonas sp.]|tara:strand:+ start:559 stop:1065 length:507 start_codon:yes stop_codon:yes gene_type:complete